MERAAIYDGIVLGGQKLVDRLRQREKEFLRLARITEHINCGITVEQVLDTVYEDMKEVIPYNRIGFSLIDPKRGVVVARWSRSDRPMFLQPGYEASLEGSTLQQVVATANPRIINDLEAYLHEKPNSRSTRLIVEEGMRSSLTCPLLVQGKAVGFMFFSAVQKGTYATVHVSFFQQIAAQLAVIVEKSRLYSDLAEKNAIIAKQNLLMTRDLEMARRVQQALIPDKSCHVEGLDIAFEYEPADQVGGDILDIIPVNGNRVLLFVGDAMGHGVQAALVMSVVKAALHSAAQSDPYPPSILGSINKVLTRLFGSCFVTAACCLVNPDGLDADAQLSLAGHAAPLWYRANTHDISGKSVTRERSDKVRGTTVPNTQNVSEKSVMSLPLGIDEATEYEMISSRLTVGDSLVIVTDGIVDALNPGGTPYGHERLKAHVLCHGISSAHELCGSIRRDLDAHCNGQARGDDLTLLVVKVGRSGSSQPPAAA